jgi:phosphohistidine phosphatase
MQQTQRCVKKGEHQMDLYIVRHGIAIDREDPQCPPDPERYLTEDGIKKTRQVAKGVAALGITPDLLISSPYVRAMQTAEIFAAALSYPKQKIRQTDSLLPGAEPSLFFRELAQDKHSTVFCFGHAPQLDELIAAAFASKQNLTALKKAGVASIKLKRVSPPSAELLWLATPKLLRRAAK